MNGLFDSSTVLLQAKWLAAQTGYADSVNWIPAERTKGISLVAGATNMPGRG